MVSVICPSCNKEVKAKSNITLAFRYHLSSDHNTICQEEQEGILKEVKALIKKQCRKKSSIPKFMPRGLHLLIEFKCSYRDTLEQLNKCCDAHPHCKYKEVCERLYDRDCNKWPVIGGSIESHTKEQPPMSIEVVIPPVSPERVLEAIERQLAVV